MRYHLFTKKRFNLVNKFFHYYQTAKFDYFLISLIVLIIIFGLLVLSSASSVEGFRKFNNAYYFLINQVLRGLLPGFVLLLFFWRVDYRFWQRYTIYFFLAALILLLLVFIPGLGVSYGRTRSWLNFFGIIFQPAEIVKLLLILSLSGWLAYRGREKNANFWNGLIPFIFILGSLALLILLQPDLGTLSVIIAIAFTIYFVAGAKLSHLFSLFLGGLGLFAVLVAQAPYRTARLMTFLYPELDPGGIGYHINQSFLAIGSGGLFGLGFGQSRQKFAYLPEVMSDSIFAILAEELGLVFSLALIILFVLLAWRGLKIIKKTADDYGKLLVVGIISWFIFQAFLNIAAMVGLLPLTGIPLPFISYGGTALATSLAAVGILLNISRQD
jgi:cell division protein FtsW